MSEAVQVEGKIQPNEVEEWTYGSHLPQDEGGANQYVLTSQNHRLADYEG